MKKIYSFALILLFILLSGNLKAQVNTITKTIAEKDPVKRYSILAEYPQFDNIENESAETVINSRVKTYTEALVNSFRNDIKDWEIPAEIPDTSAFDITYDVLYTGNDIISIKMSNYSFFAGAAHPNSMIYTMNYDARTGNPIKLTDVFNANSDYLNILSSYTQQDLIRQGEENDIEPDMWLFEQGASPKQDNFSAFNITADSLIIIFNPYQVGAYALGSWEVKIPYRQLSAVLNREGIMGRFTY